jgi:nucleotide-binding universal stress UspA family protein
MMVPSSDAIESILAALDDSIRAPAVFRAAVALAKDLGAELFLVRVLSVPPEIPAAGHSQPDHLEETLGRETRKDLHALMAAAPEVQWGPPIVVQGDPWRSILDVARDLDVDLIMMGNHGYHGLDRVLGTVATKVVNHAYRNVFIVHERTPELAGG